MDKYIHMTPREVGAEFHRIFAARDAETMKQFIFDHHLDKTSGLYTLSHERIPHGNRVTYKITIRLADENGTPRTYIVEKNLADYVGGRSSTIVYEIAPNTKFQRGEALIVHDSLHK